MSKKAFPHLKREYYGHLQCQGGTQDVKIATYHGSQGRTARGGAITLTTRDDGSAHVIFGRREGYRLAAENVVVCGVRDANTGNYHVEDSTFAVWLRKVWLLHIRQLQWSAWDIARVLRENGRRPHFIGLDEAERAGGVADLNGFTYHCVLTATTWCNSTHVDPAPNAGMGPSNFPHQRFCVWVEFYFHHPHIRRQVTRREVRQWQKQRQGR